MYMATSYSKPIYIPLEGVESEHCALIVDIGLKQIKGIGSHKVELNNRRAVIEPINGLDILPETVKAIRDLGYGVTTIKKIFPVLNMTCASCAVSVESMLKTQNGVVNAGVNFLPPPLLNISPV
jgi:Cu2+-exporting ATPase